MAIKSFVGAIVVTALLGLTSAANAQQGSAGSVAGMTPAAAAAVGLGIVAAGVLIADEVSDGGSSIIPDEPEQPEPPTTTTTTSTTTTTTTN